MDKVHETYETELGGRNLAYDGEKALFTLGALPPNNLEFTVVLANAFLFLFTRFLEMVAQGMVGLVGYRSKTFKVEISFAAKIPMQAIGNALRGHEYSENSQEALRVLDIVLRHHATKQGCLLVRQSFFRNEPKYYDDIGGGVLGCRGFHSSFRVSQGGLSLNFDVSTTMIVRPGPVADFLIENQRVNHLNHIDWAKIRVKTPKVLARDRLLGSFSVKPALDRVELTLVGIAISVFAFGWANEEMSGLEGVVSFADKNVGCLQGKLGLRRVGFGDVEYFLIWEPWEVLVWGHKLKGWIVG
ncbi:hypothetical protein H6P81_000317 [Aristolochia fimbriata]|uniref:Argonaute linker 1 domain-containing protein n=1 Tax=Aristolochia fimbriata TaxID=158543 RepID=A0AAV7F524_ARIFI|nr:hypothetical protein H6P81_000317 [Aristolochia fimbriata]